MADTAKEAVEQLTLEQLDKIVEVIEIETFITDEYRDPENNSPLLSKVMIKHAGELLIKRLKGETTFGNELDITSSLGNNNSWHEVAAIFDKDEFEDELEFKRKTLDPYIEKLKKQEFE
ncbi:hypothetical protein [Priestia megaterium]|uniref:hypothetical protein n=1 Tax=Priestia megaterium TaxID=1404 RepID=UPI000BA6EFE7|nr:hypothetical protein [Priestia megaterium]PAK47604.1 hypothetical protein CHH47_19350 [Priestia megaterium]